MATTKKRVLFSLPVVVIAILALIFSPNINKQLHAWRVLPESERLTELYFTNNTKLPTTYRPGSNQIIAFTVHNLEYRTNKYTYKITQTSQDGATTILLATGTFSLSDSKYRALMSTVNVRDLGNRSKISVELNNNEFISYWIEKTGV